MISKIQFNEFSEILALHNYAIALVEDVFLCSIDNSIQANLKSFLGMLALDLSGPLHLVSDNESIHKYADSALKIKINS